MVKFLRLFCPLIIFFLVVKPSLGNKIDSLKNDEEILAFLRPLFPNWQRGFNFAYNINQSLRGDSLNAHNWYTTDIDKNGETDLLVFRLQYGPEITAILSIKGKYKIITDYTYGGDFIYPVLRKIDDVNVVLLYNLNQISYDTATLKEITTPLACDTLTVIKNYFVNYIKYPHKYKIEAIEIKSDGRCEGNCPKINEVIYPKAFKSKCTKTEWWNKGKKFFGHLSLNQIQDILHLLNKSNFTELKSEYRSRGNDNSVTTIIITYNGGKKKIISDDGTCDNFTLKSIYRIAFDIDWKQGSS